MKQVLLSLFVFAVGGWSLGAWAHGQHHHPDQHVAFSNGVHAHLFWEAGPSLETESVLRIEFMNGKTHSPMEMPWAPGAELWMPDMGHGSAPLAIERVLDEEGKALIGTYRVSNMYFVMDGDWEVRLTLFDQNGPVETQTFNVNISEDGHDGGHHHH